MAQPSLKELLEAGAHFGHQTRRWNPKMSKFIYGARGGIHIIDLTKTAAALKEASDFAENTGKRGGKVLLVGTKRQAAPIIKDEAIKAGMPYVSERWLGGMLTNFRTIKMQINRLKKLEAQDVAGELDQHYNKREAARLRDEIAKLNHVFGGIKDMDAMPGAIFVVDTPKEGIALLEAAKLNIPVIAMADSNTNPDQVDYPVPANDDAIKAIRLITATIAQAAASGYGTYASGQKEAAAAAQDK